MLRRFIRLFFRKLWSWSVKYFTKNLEENIGKGLGKWYDLKIEVAS